jgi:hypothetical protein
MSTPTGDGRDSPSEAASALGDDAEATTLALVRRWCENAPVVSRRIAVLALALTVGLLPAATAGAVGPNAGDAVTGTGEYTSAEGTWGASVQAFSGAYGERARGFARVWTPSLELTVDVGCLAVQGGRATVAGTIVRSSAPGQIGLTAYIVVEDHGNRHDGADAITLAVGPGNGRCQMLPFAPITIARGNLSVRDTAPVAEPIGPSVTKASSIELLAP